mgnify:CR=1 FL=1
MGEPVWSEGLSCVPVVGVLIYTGGTVSFRSFIQGTEKMEEEGL